MLRTRLFLNLLPLLVIQMAAGLYAIVLFSRLTGSVDTAVEEHFQGILGAQRMRLALAAIDREAWASGSTAGESNPKIAENMRLFDEQLRLQLQNHSLPGESGLNQELSAGYAGFRGALVKLGTAGPAADRQGLYDREIAPATLKIRAVLDRILDLNQQAILATSARVQKIGRDVTRLMVIGMAIALAVSVYACYQLSRAVLQPIQLLTGAARELGQGNLDAKVPIMTRDELGELALAFNQMAAQLREYRAGTTEEIARLHRTMEATLASFPDPIFVLNTQGQIGLTNPAAAELAAALGLQGELPIHLQGIAQGTLERDEDFLPHSFDEAFCCRVKGVEKFFLPRVLRMRNREGAVFGVALVLQDVTRFRLLDAAKSDLVATVSHELKSPLTSVRMALHLLLEGSSGPLTPTQDELVRTARDDAERLLRILNDLLDLGRLERGDAGLRREDVAPAELVRAMVDESAERAAAKCLTLETAVDRELPAVFVDPQRISHVFSNLMTNAIKYSPRDGRIVVRASRFGDDGVRFSVADEGPGISEEFQSRIFDRFFRVPEQTRKGAGLGLSIAREITLAHEGSIGVESSAGRGATFHVVLKVASAFANGAAPAADAEPTLRGASFSG
jgi:NtrC-family two-component system sensor histidine kinase KinB